MTQGSLLEPRAGWAHSNASDTERAAAEAIAPNTGTKRYAILECVIISGLRGATDEELHHFTRMYRSSVCGRRRELVLDGLIEDSGRRRRGSAGLPHVVWVATPKGRLAYEEVSK